ncbi:ATP-binding cassette domain-containing protein [Promicromonospora panici]|uniref:ATP-binding cassette domain-containing protein n=1 Tax=Promicromonospora panici TaxID=2219658 RepID=UPI00101CCB08|nr:ABC transporter ATP-binding protein [Promicromonospora panici]
MSLDPFGARLDDVAVRYSTSWRVTQQGTFSKATGGIALDGATSLFPAGAITGLLGRNGAGKTTLLSLLAGFRRPTAGTVRVGPEGSEQDPFENPAIVSGVQLVREAGDVLTDEKVSATLKHYAAARPRWDSDYADRLLDLFELDVRKTPSALSRGKRSALGATIGLAARAPLTIFDEVYLGMDAPTRYAFYDELLKDYAEHPRTIILSSHLVEESERLFEHVVVVDRGRILLAEPADDMRGRGTSLTGNADAVARLAAGHRLLHRQELGPTAMVTVEGPLTDEEAAEAADSGVAIGSVPLQDLFVHLTSTTARKESER